MKLHVSNALWVRSTRIWRDVYYINFYLASIGFHCCLSTKLYAVDKGNGGSLWCTCADVTSRGPYIHLKNVCVYISSVCFMHVCDLSPIWSRWWSIKFNFLSSVCRPQPLARRGETPKLSVGDFWAKARKQNLLTKGKEPKTLQTHLVTPI